MTEWQTAENIDSCFILRKPSISSKTFLRKYDINNSFILALCPKLFVKDRKELPIKRVWEKHGQNRSSNGFNLHDANQFHPGIIT